MSKYVQDSEWGTKYPNFRKDEFRCPCCGSIGVGIASTLVQTLQELRTKYGKPINISSGYRCRNFNRKVGGSTNSAHLLGQAADWYFADGSLANQNYRIGIVNELKRTKYYHWSYCNVNGNYPNMGAAIHVDTKLVDTDAVSSKKYIKINTTSGVWCRTNGYGFKYPKYKVIPFNTQCELLVRNIGTSNGYSWDKVMYENKIVYLPNRWNNYL